MITGFEIEKIKTEYPKVYSKLEEYFKAQLDKQNAVEPLPEGFTVEWTVNLNLTHGWKGLIYFFDEQRVYITFDKEEGFTFNIKCGKRGPITYKTFETRIECEYEAISEAFKALENNL